MGEIHNTQFFKAVQENKMDVSQVLEQVYVALTEKGYNPVNQIVGYIMSGDPTYITSHKGARSLIMKVERDEILEELMSVYRCQIKVKACARYNEDVCQPYPSGEAGSFVYDRKKFMRILGLDYGSKTVGVAVCDPLGMTAQGVETITRKEENKLRKTLARIEALVEEYQVETIVLGYPKNMDDSIGERALKTEEFRNMLVRRTGLPVVLWDERLTTIEANEILIESGVRREDRKKVIDKIAATLILQSYLGSLK